MLIPFIALVIACKCLSLTSLTIHGVNVLYLKLVVTSLRKVIHILNNTVRVVHCHNSSLF
uniref:Uncharacterized protein n=1 Tax=Anguilla anguilla TaxID=7936 RepID=A0A0E9UVD2_ANGAN